VHDIPLDRLTADPALDAALARLPGRRLVFTNGSEKHAANVLDALGIAARFEEVFALDTMEGFIPKPSPAAFANLVGRHAVRPASAAFFEDMERNLAPAAQLGMVTVLVGPHAAESAADFVHHRTEALPPFLQAARVMDTAA
jgi:putative hydrolase of the HAD superfamily